MRETMLGEDDEPTMPLHYLAAHHRFSQAIDLMDALFDGVWLGLLDRTTRGLINQRSYDGESPFASSRYNHCGL